MAVRPLSHVYEPDDIPALMQRNGAQPFPALVRITPTYAAELLQSAHELDEREIATHRVKRFERRLRTDHFSLTWDAIAIDTLGRRRNGQHRLKAIQNTGVSVVMLILFNVEASAVHVGDQGAKRTMRQVLELGGEERPSALAAGLRLFWQWRQGFPIGAKAGTAVPDVTDMEEVLAAHPGLRDHTALARRLRDRANLGSEGLGVVLSYIFTRADPDEAEEFFERLATGADLDAHDPIMLLRQKLVELRGGTGRNKGVDVTYKAALTIKAFNAWRRGERLAQLQWRRGGAHPERFPDVELADASQVSEIGFGFGVSTTE